jgi:hypothetical protein
MKARIPRISSCQKAETLRFSLGDILNRVDALKDDLMTGPLANVARMGSSK